MTSDLTSSITSKYDLILRGLTSRSWPLYLSTIVEAENTHTCPNCLGRPRLASEWTLISQGPWPPSLTSFWEVWPLVSDLYVDFLQYIEAENTQTCPNCLGWPQNDLWPQRVALPPSLTSFWEVWPHVADLYIYLL